MSGTVIAYFVDSQVCEGLSCSGGDVDGLIKAWIVARQ
jgi:hypothetical protein